MSGVGPSGGEEQWRRRRRRLGATEVDWRLEATESE
ncbi:unnamed protein product [Rhodiola kirilowii]